MKPWETAVVPEEAGVSSRGILNYLDAVERSGGELHAVMILRHGRLACSIAYGPYDTHTPHMLYSLSKSFCSAAAGFAVAEGLLRYDDRVLDVLPDAAPEAPDEWLQTVTLSHLLSMGSGLAPESDHKDTAREVLSCGCDHAPGTHFHYNSHGTYLVSCMVQRVTGMSVRDYLMPRLFEPLGISKPEWDLSGEGVCWGGWGLHLSCESIARFGQCLLQNGVWQGRQVLPEGWVELATSTHIDNANGVPQPNSDWAQGYGYQFWRTRGGRYRGDGMYGQICMISQAQEMVVAITAGLNDMHEETQLLHEYLFPAADMPPATRQEQEALQKRLETLAYPWPDDDGSGRLEMGDYTGDGMRLTLAAEDGALALTAATEDGQTPTLRFGLGRVEPSVFALDASLPTLRWQGACGWKNGTLHLLMRTVEGPFLFRCAITPEGGNTLRLESETVGMPQPRGMYQRA